MSARDMAVFASETDARDAYFGEGPYQGADDPTSPGTGPGAGGTDPGAGWMDPEEVDVLEGNWWLLVQEEMEGTATRYFLVVGPDPDRTLVMHPDASTSEVSEDDTFDDLPSFATEDDARDTHATWLENWTDPAEQEPPEQNEETTDQDGNTWSAWELLEEVPPWSILVRFREDGEELEAVIAGVQSDEQIVYLHPGVEISEEPYVYDDLDAVDAALEAYFAAVEDGDVPEEDQPTGDRPDLDQVARDAGLPGLGSGPQSQRETRADDRLLGRLIRTVARRPMLVVALLLGGFIVHRQMAENGSNPLSDALGRLRGGGR